MLDILPTYNYWERMNRAYALKIYHWTFLAQPAPLPETLISSNGEFFLRFKMASQTKSKTLDAIDERALEHYIAPFRDPARVHAMCEDYRAGAYFDYDLDKADFDSGKKITIPMLALWGNMASPRPPPRRSTPGSNGPRRWTACRWIQGTSSPRRTLT